MSARQYGTDRLRPAEHEALHEALLEALTDDRDREENGLLRGYVFGLRVACGMLGLPEGSTEYVWPETGTRL